MQTPRYEPLQSLLRASPSTGRGRYDFIRALLKAMAAAPQGEHKWDLVGEVLHHGREKARALAGEGDCQPPPTHASLRLTTPSGAPVHYAKQGLFGDALFARGHWTI